MANIKLSILVPTVPNRLEFFYPRIMTELLRQNEKWNKQVEILALFDNKIRTIGEKRQQMIDIAKGEYMVFVDDDDRVTKDYIDQIMNALINNPDCDLVVFDQMCVVDKAACYFVKLDKEYEENFDKDGILYRVPNHIMVYKSDIIRKHKFNNLNIGEDIDWAKRAVKDVKKQVRIPKPLYFYEANYNTTSETNNIPDEIIKKNIKLLMEKKTKK